MRVAGCFMEHDGRFLILHRWPHKSQGNRWGLPAGKVEPDERDVDAIIREIKEETGYDAKEEDLTLIGDWTWKFPNKTVDFPTFRLNLTENIDIRLQENEHSEYRWVAPEECYAMDNLVHGFHELLKLTGKIKDF